MNEKDMEPYMDNSIEFYFLWIALALNCTWIVLQTQTVPL